ncbi:MAG: DNA helicase RecQ [Bacteroidetes bacterium]|nr:DNA helicase RecQ [Bacteroidota bacterium]
MNEYTGTTNLEDLLQKHFGYKTFRSQQKAIIEEVLQGKDAVVLMPTGGGKSMCYQLPALVFEGLAVVISPLIALMKDQVQALRANGIAAAFLNSSLSSPEVRNVESAVEEGRIKLLYVSPERLLVNGFLDYLRKLNVSFFAIDEAHCVSSWGHSFRPDYKKLSIIKQKFPDIPVMALTATADRAVRSDIGQLLLLDNPKFFIASFDRPNLSLAVLPGQKKWEQLYRIVSKYPNQCGIIYCNSRKSTESLAEKLANKGISAKPYHAGLGAEVRDKTQDAFIQGHIDIVVATIAFGMGIDKADVRFVIHFNMPGNLEGYYQEIGRAGRDGLPSEAILFYSYRDVQTHLGFIDNVEDPAYKKIQMAKLKRMQDYAESPICRRKVLLTYFSEIPESDCGNCDVCQNPPVYFDGTTYAQMALSAIARSKETMPASTLVDVLKGSRSFAVNERGFYRIKTFGAGRQESAFAWKLFIQQFLQQGIVDIDYKDYYNLKLTSLSKEILFEGEKVRLVSPDTIKERQKRQKEKPKRTANVSMADEDLYNKLRDLRQEIANRMGKPPFVVFSNATLTDMTAIKPTNIQELLEVHGVGEHKAKKFGKRFMEAIMEYLQES